MSINSDFDLVPDNKYTLSADAAIQAAAEHAKLGSSSSTQDKVADFIAREDKGETGIGMKLQRAVILLTAGEEYKAQRAAKEAIELVAKEIPGVSSFKAGKPSVKSYQQQLTELANEGLSNLLSFRAAEKTEALVHLGADLSTPRFLNCVIVNIAHRYTYEQFTEKVAQDIAKFESIGCTLVEAGADVHARNKEGRSVAAYASCCLPLGISPLRQAILDRAVADTELISEELTNLPDEMIKNILEHLPPRDAVDAGRICKRFKDMQDENFFLEVIRNNFPNYTPVAPLHISYKRQLDLLLKCQANPIRSELVEAMGGQLVIDKLPLLDVCNRMGSTGHLDYIQVKDLTAPIMRGIDRSNRPFLVFCVRKNNKYAKYQLDAETIVLFQRYSKDQSSWYPHEFMSPMIFPGTLSDYTGGIDGKHIASIRTLLAGTHPEARFLTPQEVRNNTLLLLLPTLEGADEKTAKQIIAHCEDLFKSGVDVLATYPKLDWSVESSKLHGKSLALLASRYLPHTSELYQKIAKEAAEKTPKVMDLSNDLPDDVLTEIVSHLPPGYWKDARGVNQQFKTAIDQLLKGEK